MRELRWELRQVASGSPVARLEARTTRLLHRAFDCHTAGDVEGHLRLSEEASRITRLVLARRGVERMWHNIQGRRLDADTGVLETALTGFRNKDERQGRRFWVPDWRKVGPTVARIRNRNPRPFRGGARPCR